MLLSFGKYANIRLMRLFCTVALLSSVALAAGLEEGDSCKLHSGAIGICRQDNMCDAIKDAINNRELTVQDVVHCGFWQMGELICCPTNQPVTLPPPTTTTEFIFSSSSVRSETRNDLTNSERPAVRACQQIDAGLSAALTPHILNGVRAEDKEFPHMAAIGVRDIGSTTGPYIFNCGGSLIASRYVLTAAHCVIRITPSIVRMGVTDIMTDTNAVDIPIALTHIHPNFSDLTKVNDIAVIELAYDANYTAFVYPICLHTDMLDPPADSMLYVTGWGEISTRTRTTSNVLLKASLQIDPLINCMEAFRRENVQLFSGHLCAHGGNSSRDACHGDSGGPLNLILDPRLRKQRIVGIISAGFSCGSGLAGLYTRVAAYLDFVESVVWPAK